MMRMTRTATWYLGVVSSQWPRAHRWGFEEAALQRGCRRLSGCRPDIIQGWGFRNVMKCSFLNCNWALAIWCVWLLVVTFIPVDSMRADQTKPPCAHVWSLFIVEMLLIVAFVSSICKWHQFLSMCILYSMFLLCRFILENRTSVHSDCFVASLLGLIFIFMKILVVMISQPCCGDRSPALTK